MMHNQENCAKGDLLLGSVETNLYTPTQLIYTNFFVEVMNQVFHMFFFVFFFRLLPLSYYDGNNRVKTSK